jgi:hypothetical protein
VRSRRAASGNIFHKKNRALCEPLSHTLTLKWKTQQEELSPAAHRMAAFSSSSLVQHAAVHGRVLISKREAAVQLDTQVLYTLAAARH